MLESMAKRNCPERATDAEVEQTRDLYAINSITASYDMGWQKRGTGKCDNSLSGVGHLVGQQTNKVIRLATFSKKMCDMGES